MPNIDDLPEVTDKEVAALLRRQGWTYKAIGERLGVTGVTIRMWLNPDVYEKVKEDVRARGWMNRKPHTPYKTDEEKQAAVARAREMREMGYTYKAIGSELGISGAAVRLWLDQKAKDKADEYDRMYAQTEQGREVGKRSLDKFRATARGRFAWKLLTCKYLAKKHGYAACTATIEELASSWTGRCFVCNKSEVPEAARGKGLCMDHCHETGKFRGWLCHECNTTLGKVNHDPVILQRLIFYLSGSL